MDEEAKKIFDQYERRKNDERIKNQSKDFYFNHYAQSERELKYQEILKKKYSSLDSVSILEIGAGSGINLYFFKKLGLKWENIYANELLEDRIKQLKENFPIIEIYEGDGRCILPEKESTFDIIFQSTVFTSILDNHVKKELAHKMWSLLKPGGIILWYDFVYDNPQNKDVKGIKIPEIKSLFPEYDKISINKVTLAPFIGRRIKKFYSFINLLPFLRTHIIAVIQK